MRNGLGKASSVYKSDDEGSGDDMPVVGYVRVSSKHLTRLFPVRRVTNVIRPQVDSDEKVHMTSSSTVQTKTSTGALSCKPVHNEQKRPLVNNIKLKSEVRKRTSSSNQSSAKRPKLSEPTTMEQGSSNADSKGKKNLEAFKRLRVNQVTVKEDNPDGDDDDHVPIASRIKQSSVKKPNASKTIASSSRTIAKNKWVKKDSKSVLSRDVQKKWTTLEHNGVLFPPPYKCHGVKIMYQGKPVDLTPEQEEVATMFAKMRDTAYYNKPLFRENFWNDWGELLGKNHVIRNLDDCDFSPIYEWYIQDIKIRAQLSAEEKIILKEENLKQEEKYMWAVIDGVREKVSNFRVEPPGLFRGRGDHPKMGKLKKRIRPCDITINIGKDAPIPECPIPGERWKEVKHDSTVSWLAFWNDPINPKVLNHVFLLPSSALKKLGAACTRDLTNKDATKRETEFATDLIDKLSLRAEDEKVAIISGNDQRTVSESHGQQVERLDVKIEELRVKATDSSVPVFTEPATQLADVVLASEVPKETALTPEKLKCAWRKMTQWMW